MNNENDSIRNGIIVTVVGGIILAILAWAFDGVFQVLKSIASWVLSSITYTKQGFIAIWNYFQSPVTISWGLLWLLSILSIIALWKILRPVINPLVKKDKAPKPYKPRLDDYKQDVVFNIKWEWSDIYGTLPNEPAGFCPNCLTRLVYTVDIYSEKTSFICEHCNRTIITLDGNLRYALSTVARQIERRIKTGEWENIVTRQHNQKTG